MLKIGKNWKGNHIMTPQKEADPLETLKNFNVANTPELVNPPTALISSPELNTELIKMLLNFIFKQQNTIIELATRQYTPPIQAPEEPDNKADVMKMLLEAMKLFKSGKDGEE